MQLPLSAADAPFYIGTYTGPGKADGILMGNLNTETGKLSPITLATASSNPGFLALSPDGRFLYASLESAGGAVASYRVEKNGSLTLLNELPSAGAGACHVWFASNHVFVANYSSGNIAVFSVKPDGSLDRQTSFFQFTGSGPDPKRQKQSYAHGMITTSDGKFAYACDLGSDNVWSFALDAQKGTLTPTDPPSGRVPPGGGPRHLALSKDENFLYTNNEMGLSVTAFKRDPTSGVLTAIQTIPSLPADAPTEGVKTSEIMTHPSGKWLYVSNRVHDSLTVYAIGTDGQLTLVENVPATVKTPRGFAIDPSGKWLLAAGQKDNTLAVLKIDPATGRLTATDERTAAAVPVCIAFAPRP